MTDDGVVVHLTEREAALVHLSLRIMELKRKAEGFDEWAEEYRVIWERVVSAREDALSGDDTQRIA